MINIYVKTKSKQNFLPGLLPTVRAMVRAAVSCTKFSIYPYLHLMFNCQIYN